MKKILSSLMLTLLCVGGWASIDVTLPDLSSYAVSSVGDMLTSADNITASTSTSSQWYVITQIRGGETPIYDNGNGYAMRAATSKTVSAVLTENTLVSEVSSYLVRFIDAGISNSDDGSKGYYVQFATGNAFYNSENSQSNATQASSSNETIYLTYAVTNTDDQSTLGFGLNYTTDGTYGRALNN